MLLGYSIRDMDKEDFPVDTENTLRKQLKPYKINEKGMITINKIKRRKRMHVLKRFRKCHTHKKKQNNNNFQTIEYKMFSYPNHEYNPHPNK